MLSNAWVLVGGGSGGVGQAVSRRLAEDGWNVAVTYHRNVEAANDLGRELCAMGVGVEVMQADLSEWEAAVRCVDRVSQLGHLGAVAYTAGPAFEFKHIINTEASEFQWTVCHDLGACFNLLKASLPHLRESRGSIVALTTPAVRRYSGQYVLSAVPKAGIEMLVRAIAAEEGRFGVRANCISVGYLEDAGMWSRMVADGVYTEDQMQIVRGSIALRRFGSVRDVAESVRFLMSDDANWITGQVIGVEGT